MSARREVLERNGQFVIPEVQKAFNILRPAPVSLELNGKEPVALTKSLENHVLDFGPYWRNGRKNPLLLDPAFRMKRMTLIYLTDDENRILMLRKNRGRFASGLWNGLGGRFEKGENKVQCLTREVGEESGLTLRSAEYVGVFTAVYKDSDQLHMVYVYRSSEFTGVLKTSDEGKLKWFQKESVPIDKMLESTRTYVNYALNGQPFMAHFEYDSIAELNVLKYEFIRVARDELVY